MSVDTLPLMSDAYAKLWGAVWAFGAGAVPEKDIPSFGDDLCCPLRGPLRGPSCQPPPIAP